MIDKIMGLKIVGYRYGKAPENGKSWNYQKDKWECGVSMACVGYGKEVGSFAVSGSTSRKKFYYVGTVCGTGGDDEICLSNVKQITYNEYRSLRKKMIVASNIIVNAKYDRLINLTRKGFNLGKTEEEINDERKLYLK